MVRASICSVQCKNHTPASAGDIIITSFLFSAMSSYYIPWIGAALITATAAAVYYWAQSTPGTRRRRRPDNADSSASGHSSSAAHPDSASLRQRRVNHLQDDGAGVPGHVGGSLSGAVPRAQPTAPISAAQWRPLPRGPVLTPAESEALMSAQTSAFFEARDTREVEAVARRQQLDEDRYVCVDTDREECPCARASYSTLRACF